MTTECSSPLVVDTDRTHFSHLLLSAIDPVTPGAAGFIHYSCMLTCGLVGLSWEFGQYSKTQYEVGQTRLFCYYVAVPFVH